VSTQATGTSPTQTTQKVTFGPPAAMKPVTMSPTELVALCEVGMEGFDQEIARKTAHQRDKTSVLKLLGELKAKMARHQNGLEAGGDEERAGGDKKVGRERRGEEFSALYADFEAACKELPSDLRHVAEDSLRMMEEQGKRAFNADQANRMSENIESAISDITTGQQAEMAEINDLMSKRSNMIEMTKNIATALNGQQEFISRNAPR